MAVALCAGLLQAVPAASLPTGAFEYRIDRDGSPIGKQRLTVTQHGDKTTVSIDVKVQVKVAFVTVYRYEQARSETWQGDRLTALDTRTNDNGDKLFLKGHANASDFAIETEKGHTTAPLGLVPASYWNIATVDQKRLLDVEDGRVLNITVTAGTNESVDLGSRQIQARYFQIAGDVDKELWYDPSGVLLKIRFKARDGSLIEFVLR
ncbi:MAG: DUF6134 family protein [Alphaproteobacteria bacterium]